MELLILLSHRDCENQLRLYTLLFLILKGYCGSWVKGHPFLLPSQTPSISHIPRVLMDSQQDSCHGCYGDEQQQHDSGRGVGGVFSSSLNPISAPQFHGAYTEHPLLKTVAHICSPHAAACAHSSPCCDSEKCSFQPFQHPSLPPRCRTTASHYFNISTPTKGA